MLFTTATLDFDAVELHRRDVPYVLLIRSVAGLEADSVVSDNVDGGCQVGEHLLAAGHQRIGMVAGPPNTSTARDRSLGFRTALSDGGHPLDDDLCRDGSYSYQSGYQRATELLGPADRPTALFCGNDMIAFGALDAARRLGMDVPGDVSIVGFDDIPMAEWRAFGLTTVRQSLEEMAQTAAGLLIGQIEHPSRGSGAAPDPPRQEVHPVSFVERATVGSAPH